MLPVAETATVVLSIPKAVWVRIVRDLVVVLAKRGHHPQLISQVRVEDQRTEAAIPVLRIVGHIGRRRLQTQIAAVSVQAGVVSKTIGVAAEIDLTVSLIEVAKAVNQLGLVVALESGTRRDVENAVGPVAELRAITATVGF